MNYLALVRHGQSSWNAQGCWTGLTDISLSEIGKNEAQEAGEALKDIKFDLSFTSNLRRAQQTLDEIKKVLGQEDLETVINSALNERDYGDLTGRNKWEVEKQYGKEQFQKWRRSWDYPIPNGETLKDVYERVIPYYQQVILPKLQSGKNVIISAHGNSLRALIKYLENISDTDISNLEVGFGEIYLYQMNNSGKIIKKEIRAVNKNS